MRAFRFGIAGFAVLVEAAVAVALVFTSNRDENPWLVAAFASIAGALLRRCRPGRAVAAAGEPGGLPACGTGYLWFFAALTESNNSWVWTVGFILGNLAFVAFATLILAYPEGRLSRRDRWLVGIGGTAAILGNLIVALVDETPSPDCAVCPPSAIAVTNAPGLAEAVILVGSVVVAVVLIWIVVDPRPTMAERLGRPAAHPPPRARVLRDGRVAPARVGRRRSDR